MKNLFIVLFSIALLMPLNAQEFEEDIEPAKANKKSYVREHFELGLGLDRFGVGFDNGLIGINNIFKKDIELDFGTIAGNIPKDGANVNFDILMDVLFVNIKNINIKGGKWDFGFFSGVKGDLNANIPKSLFTLISQGNINQRTFDGTINAAGGVFASAGFSGAAKYDKLRLGIKPVLYAPLVYIPKSGINFHLDSDDHLLLLASGGISVYSPFIENGELKFGFDLSLEGEYSLFSFLDVGGNFSQIPIVPVTLTNRLHLTMDGFSYELRDPLTEEIPPLPDLEFNNEYNSARVRALRPLRFDVYARYKPFFNEFLVIKPNIGFSYNFARGRAFFNTGLEAQLNLKDIFKVHLCMDFEEAIWKHRLGFALNLRAFEWVLEASLRSQTFAGSFKGQGFGFTTGLSFGW
jgi:hypothetical protein